MKGSMVCCAKGYWRRLVKYGERPTGAPDMLRRLHRPRRCNSRRSKTVLRHEWQRERLVHLLRKDKSLPEVQIRRVRFKGDFPIKMVWYEFRTEGQDN